MRREWLCAGLLALLTTLAACSQSAFEQDELARFDVGSTDLDMLDGHVMSLSPQERSGDGGKLPPVWYEAQIERLFIERVFEASAAFEALQGDSAFQSRWLASTIPTLARAYLLANQPIPVTQEEVVAIFEAEREQLRRPERRVLYNIFLPVPPAASVAEGEAICAELGAIRARVEAGESFEEMARTFSRSATAALGGVVGAVEPGFLAAPLEAVVFALEAGEMSDVVRDRFGCHLFRVAQIQSSIEPSFTAQREGIRQRLEQQRRAEHFTEQLQLVATDMGIALPQWSIPADSEPDQVLFEHAGQQVAVVDVQARVRAQRIDANSAFKQLVGELLFAEAFRSRFPDRASAMLEQDKRRAALDHLRQEALRAELGSIEEQSLRSYYEQHRPRYSSEPSVELEIHHWSFADSEPFLVSRGAEAFAEALRNGDAVGIAQHGSENPIAVPLTPVRSLAQSNPDLTAPLLGDFEEGDVLGPFRFADGLAVARVGVLIPTRQLSFLEVRERVLGDYLRSEGYGIEAAWIERLKQKHAFRLNRPALAEIGARLLARMDQVADERAAH